MNTRCLALLAVLAAPAAAQQGFEHVVPSDAVFYAGAVDIEALGRAFRDSPSGRFWYDPANAPLREALEARVDALTAQMHAELGVDPLDLFDMLHGRLAIATVGLPRAEDLDDGPPRGFGVAFLADVGSDRDACEDLFSSLADRLAEELGAVRKSAMAGDTEVSVLDIGGGSDEHSVRFKHAIHESTLVLTVELHPMQPDAMETLIARLDGEPGESLADTPRFADTLAAETGGTQLWIDFGRIMDVVRAAAEAHGEDDEALDIMRRCGLFDLGCLAMCSNYEPSGTRMHMRLDWSGDGWIQTFARLACVPGPATTLSVLPADCVSAFAAHVDFTGLFDAIVKALIDSGAATMADVVGFLTDAEDNLGFNPRDDLLDSLDNQVTLASCPVPAEEAMPGVEGGPENMVLMLGLKDGSRLNTLVEDAVRKTGLHAARKRSEFQGYEVFSVPVFPPFDVHYAMLPDMAVISLSGTLLQDVLRRKAGSDLPTLADNQEFKERLASLTHTPGMLEYQDTAANAKAAFRALASLGDMLREFDVGPLAGLVSLLEDLPPTDDELIDKHLKGATVAALSVDERGFAMEAVSP